MIWTPSKGVIKEIETHKGAISVTSWSPDGNRLITADKKGGICVWSPKHDGSLILLCKYQQQVPSNYSVFSVQEGAKGKKQPYFFLGSEKGGGKIFFADDKGNCIKALTIDDGVLFMHVDLDKNYLIIVTQNAVLLKYRISKMKMTQESKSKLSIRGGGADMKCTMAGPGLLAASNAEGMIRRFESSGTRTFGGRDDANRISGKFFLSVHCGHFS